MFRDSTTTHNRRHQPSLITSFHQGNGGKLIDNLHENQIVNLWQHLLPDNTGLTTDSGEPIRVIYPGRVNDGQGADFRDAVIATSQGLVKGDIEIHVRSSDWYAHQHHRNPPYNRVILHVVMRHDSQTATRLQNGSSIPTLTLDRFLTDQDDLWCNRACPRPALHLPCFGHGDSFTTDIAAESLDSSGEKRFLAKADKFKTDIIQHGPGQSLYQGIMGALGYSKNKLPFLELARRLPVHVLESMTRNKASDEKCLARLQARLLGTAGLLPSQRQDRHQQNRFDDRFVDTLEKLWPSFHFSEVLSSDEWEVYRVRPANFPARRIVAMSHLLLRYREKGMLTEMVNMVEQAHLNKGHHRLEAGLVVNSNSYWGTHFDLGSGIRIDNSPLLGKGRAADTVVNVLLPFTFAWGGLNSRPELRRKSLDLYRSYPRLAVNTVEQHMMRQLGLNSSQVDSAQRQQGLIHIYNTLCTEGKCNCCPLAKTA